MLIVAARALSSAALAQGYVGALIGQSDYQVDCTDLTTCDTKDTGYKLFGGCMFTRNLGIEGGRVNLGEVKATGELDIPPVVTAAAELKASGPFLAGIAVAPIGSGSVFGKVGLANLKSKASVTLLGITDSTSKRHTDLFYGIGAGYDFTKNFGVRAEWERFRIKSSDGVEASKDNVEQLAVGVVYRF